MTTGSISPDRMLIALLAIMGISLIHPQAAYPMMGATLGAPIAGIAILMLLRWHAEGWKGMSFPVALAFAMAAAWSTWWLFSWFFISEVPVLGTFAVATILQATCVFVAFVAILALLPSEWNLRHLLSCWLVVVCSLVALHAIYQVIGPSWLPYTFAARIALLEAQPDALHVDTRQGIMHALREARASGVFGSPNVLAGFLAMGLPLSIAMTFERFPRWLRFSFAVCAAVMILAIIMSGSRGGLLGALLGVVAVMVLLAPRLMAKGTLAAMLMVVFLGAASTSGFFERWTGVSTVQQRFLYWDSAIAIWSESPILGRGPGGFELHYSLHRDPRANETRFAHSWFFQWGSEVGIVGLVIFAGWVCTVLFAGLRQWRQAAGRDPLVGGLLAAMLVLLLHGLVEFTLSIREVFLHFALVAALLVADTRAKSPLIAKPVGIAAASLVVLLFSGAWWWFQYAPARAEQYRELVGIESEADDLRFLSRAIQWQPNDPRLWEARAFTRFRMGTPGARDDMQRALALNPYSSRIHESMGRLAWAAGDREGAMQLQRESMRLHPADPGRRLVMANYLLEMEDLAAASSMIETTEGLLWTRTEMLVYRDDLLRRIAEAESQRTSTSPTP